MRVQVPPTFHSAGSERPHSISCGQPTDPFASMENPEGRRGPQASQSPGGRPDGAAAAAEGDLQTPQMSIRIRRASTAPMRGLNLLPRQPTETDGEEDEDNALSHHSLSPLKQRMQQFSSRVASANSAYLFSQAEELWSSGGPPTAGPPDGVARLVPEGFPRCLDMEIWELFADIQDETDAAKLKGRLGALAFWFEKVAGDLGLWISRAVSLQQRLDLVQKQLQQEQEQHQRQRVQHEAVSRKQVQDLAASRQERDELLEQLYWLRRSLDTARTAQKEAEQKALEASSQPDKTTQGVRMIAV